MTTAAVKTEKIKKRRDIAFPICNTIILVLLCFITLYPVLNTVAYSFNDGLDAVKGGIGLWPRKFSTESYVSLIQDPAIYRAFFISFSKTILTTFLNLFWTGMLAYALSRRRVKESVLVGSFGTAPFLILVGLCTLLATVGAVMKVS